MRADPSYRAGHWSNPHATPGTADAGAQHRILGREGFEAAWTELTAWPGYAPTPLVSLPGLAGRLGLRDVRYKDEARRFGQGSFKALGGAYAVYRLLEAIVRRAAPGARVTSAQVRRGDFRAFIGEVTVTCASAGNHGRSVAWGARQFGCRCVIYVAANVTAERVAGIAQYGADVVRVDGTYDEAVRRSAADAARNGWHVVSDTSYAGYRDVPAVVMQGYRVLMEEVARQWPAGERPTHVFVQCGVGGLAAAVCTHGWEAWGAERPRLVVVEPEAAACMYETARHGQPTPVEGALETTLVCLACGDVSVLAWEILRAGADDFLTIPDAAAEEALSLVRMGVDGDPAMAVHGSGAAGVAGLLVGARQDSLRSALALHAESRVLVIGSEG